VKDEYAAYANEQDEVDRVRGFECFTPAPLPDGINRDVPNRCSVTTLKLVAHVRGKQLCLTPARGYALFRDSDGAGLSWLGHWWAVTPDGEVADASLPEPGLAYIGERVGWAKERTGPGKVALSAHRLDDGSLITDLGVYTSAPAAVEKELELKRAVFESSQQA
jgi:hypothetical protein